MYTTDVTIANLNLELTSIIPSIPITDPDFTNDYWLGWVSYDNLPYSYHISSFVWDTTNDTTYLNDVTERANVPIGYCSSYWSTDSAQFDQGVILTYDPTNEVWGRIRYTPTVTENPSYYCRLPNKLDVNTSQLGNELWIGIFYVVNDTACYTTWVNVGITGMIDDNDFALTMGSYTATKKLSDFADYEFLQDTDSGNTYKYCIFAWRCSVNDPSVDTTGSSATVYQKIHPMIRVRESLTGSNRACVMGYRADPNMGNYYSIVQYDGYLRGLDGNIFESDVFNWIFGGYIGSFKISDWTAYRGTIGIYKPDTALTFFLESFGNSNYGYIHRIFTRDEIYKMCALQHRFTTVTSNVYSNNGQIYAKVDINTNEFTTDFVYGEDFRDLTDWQYIGNVIEPGTFDPDDIPPYTPTQDDEGSNTGDDITRPTTLGVGGTNGFITQYSLTAAQMAEIGNLLWLSFTDPDYYKNFLFALATTGTLNLSNLLDYFVSLRVYPFPLINVPSHAAAGNDMYIGAGIVPLGFSSTLHTINNYADYIDVGSCTIPRYYNDFRDLTHTQIMLYLPYCGTVQLNPADVVGGTLAAKYAIDFATGGCTAYVDLTTFDGRKYPIAVLSGSIGADVPLTASNAAAIAARIAGDALNFAGTVGDAITGDIGKSAQAIGSAAMGDIGGAAAGVANVYAGRVSGALNIAQTGLQIATERGVQMPMMAGGRGFGAFGAPQTAYVQIRRGIYAEGQQPKRGYKAAYGQSYDQPVQVSSCTGFTVFANVDTSGLQCDAMEREQITKMMQAGIYI